MLIKKLIIKNFKGISERQEIDFSVENKAKKNLENHLMFKKEGETLIPLVIGFMGKNASGKTSILDAIGALIDWFFNDHILFREFYLNKNHEKIFNQNGFIKSVMSNEEKNKELNKLMNEFIKLSFEIQKKLFSDEYHNFLEWIFDAFSNDQENPIEIEIIFVNKNDNYKLKIHLTPKKLNKWKFKNKKAIMDLPTKIGITRSFFNEINIPMLLNLILKQQWQLIELIGVDLYNVILQMLDNNVKEISFTKNENNKIRFENIDMKNGSKINFKFLSTGTIKILNFIAHMTIIDKQNENLTIFIADEINNYLHAKLVDFLFKFVCNNLNNSQIIFTTHSPGVVENIDRHAIWVIQNEDKTKIKKVGSIIRKDNSFYKKFISEEISSHPSSSEINEVLYKLKENKK